MYGAASPRHPLFMSEHTTHTQSIKRLERSSSDRIVAGVAGGLGRYFDLNPNFFRLGFVVLTLLGGAGILVYLAALLVVPEEGKEHSIAAEAIAGRRERPWPLIGLGLAGVALAVLLSRATIWPSAGIGWVLVLLAGLYILRSSRRTDARPHRLLRWLAALTVAVVVAIAVAAGVTAAWFDVSLGDGVGSRVVAPTSAADLKPTYELGIGDLRVDLSNVGPVISETHVLAKVGIGELRIVVPRGVSVSANATAKAGEVYVLGRHDDGRHAKATTGTSSGELVIEARVGAGRIDIVRAES
jgi:phage shock protein PspC (stress-responsive transcriptional regulator)